MGYSNVTIFILTILQGGLVLGRYCFQCSGSQCMVDPSHISLAKYGRVKCHPVDEFCTTHVRYQLVKFTHVTFPPVPFDTYDIRLGPEDYFASSVTRQCSKTHLGNTCRRDWLGKPEITCITTCDVDFCNCDTRSPPQYMFSDGKPLPLAPTDSIYDDSDLRSCRKGDAKTEDVVKRRRKIKQYVPSSSTLNRSNRIYIVLVIALFNIFHQ